MHTASQGLRSLQGTRARSHAASQDLRSLQDRVRALEVQVARNEAAAARVPGLEAQVCVCVYVCLCPLVRVQGWPAFCTAHMLLV